MTVTPQESFSIALIAPTDTGGGIAAYSTQFAAELRAEGHTVDILPIEEPATANPWRFNRLLESIPATADLVHVQYEAGVFGRLGVSGICTIPFYRALSRRPVPVVTTVHEVHDTWPNRGRLAGGVLRLRDTVYERAILGGSTAVVVHSTAARDILERRHWTETPIESWKHPVDARRTDEDSTSYSFPGEFTVSTFGWIESKKRYTDVIRCLPDHPEMDYVIAGEPRTESDRSVLDDALDLADELDVADRVSYVGYVPEKDLPGFFANVDVAVLPYETVTQSGAANTALAYQVPVVATALPGFSELASEWDCLVQYETRSDLCAELHNLARDDERLDTLRRNAAEYANSVTWSAFIEEITGLYGEIVGRGTR